MIHYIIYSMRIHESPECEILILYLIAFIIILFYFININFLLFFLMVILLDSYFHQYIYHM